MPICDETCKFFNESMIGCPSLNCVSKYTYCTKSGIDCMILAGLERKCYVAKKRGKAKKEAQDR